MKKRFLYISGVIVFLVLLSSTKDIRDTLVFSLTKTIATHQQELWFHYPKIDSVFNSDMFRYFLFYNKKDSVIERDSTLMILNENLYFSDSTVFNIKNKVYLPSNAFSFLMEENYKYMLYRIDSIETEGGITKYKLRKIKF